MAVVLTILKILGIILLCLIGLLLLILLAVLFVPIRYRVEGEVTDERQGGSVRIRWFIFRFLGDYTYKQGFRGKAKLGWITVRYINGEEELKHKKRKPPRPQSRKSRDEDEEELPEADDIPKLPAEAGTTEPVEVTETAKVTETSETSEATETAKVTETPEPTGTTEGADQTAAPDTGQITDTGPVTEEKEDVEIFGPGKPAETKQEAKARKKREKAEAKARKAQAKEEEEFEKLPEDHIIFKLKQILDKLETKQRHIRQFLDMDYVKRTIARGKKLIVKLLKRVRPRKSGIFLHIGFGSAADTGMLLGKIAWLYPIYGRFLYVEPDFYHKVINVKGEVRGRIRIGTIVIPALLFYIRKDTRRTVKMAKKI